MFESVRRQINPSLNKGQGRSGVENQHIVIKSSLCTLLF